MQWKHIRHLNNFFQSLQRLMSFDETCPKNTDNHDEGVSRSVVLQQHDLRLDPNVLN